MRFPIEQYKDWKVMGKNILDFPPIWIHGQYGVFGLPTYVSPSGKQWTRLLPRRGGYYEWHTETRSGVADGPIQALREIASNEFLEGEFEP